MMKIKYFWLSPILGLALLLGCPSAGLTAPALMPEKLHYTVDALFFKDAGWATISLSPAASGEFVGVIEGETSGVISWFTAHRRDKYQTRMQLQGGRLVPLNYTEESWRRGRHHYKEYRFDYQKHRLELWQRQENGEMELKWQTELSEPFYDPISAFYNFRLGALGAIKGGETIIVSGIPYPEPEEIVIRIGLKAAEGQKVTVAIRNRAFENESGLVHLVFDADLVPQSAWTRVLKIRQTQGPSHPPGTTLALELRLPGCSPHPAQARQSSPYRSSPPEADPPQSMPAKGSSGQTAAVFKRQPNFCSPLAKRRRLCIFRRKIRTSEV